MGQPIFRRTSSVCSAVLVVIVLALQACATDPLNERPLPPPDVLSPETGVDVVVNAPMTYRWTAVPGAMKYEFHLFDRSNGDYSRYYFDELAPGDVCSDGVCELEVAAALPYMSGHAWRVRAGNYAGWSNWTRREFTMVEAAPANRLGVADRPQ